MRFSSEPKFALPFTGVSVVVYTRLGLKMVKNTFLVSQMIPFSTFSRISNSNNLMYQFQGTLREENATPYINIYFAFCLLQITKHLYIIFT